MTADWSGTFTEDRYTTQGSRHLRALLAELKPGPLADEVALPAGVTVSWKGDVPQFGAAVPGLLALVDELRKLARSPSGSAAQLEDLRFEVNNELEAPGTERTVRLPWHGWHALAQVCERFATHEPQAGRMVRFDYYNFSTGEWLRDRGPETATPLSRQAPMGERRPWSAEGRQPGPSERRPRFFPSLHHHVPRPDL
jgi:hypothetical protein